MIADQLFGHGSGAVDGRYVILPEGIHHLLLLPRLCLSAATNSQPAGWPDTGEFNAFYRPMVFVECNESIIEPIKSKPECGACLLMFMWCCANMADGVQAVSPRPVKGMYGTTRDRS
jgi:hypothetical protein